jgi:hypothetical protein
VPPSKMDEWFQARWWRVVDANGTAHLLQEDGDLVKAEFIHGHFTIESPGAFKSPLSGNPGRKGVLLQEVDAEGKDIPGSRYPFGEPAVEKARGHYGAIV